MSQELCRLCAKKLCSESSLQLFEKSNHKIIFAVKQVTGIKLKKEINMPNQICIKCETSLEQALDFREMCKRSQLALRKSAKGVSNNDVDVDILAPTTNDSMSLDESKTTKCWKMETEIDENSIVLNLDDNEPESEYTSYKASRIPETALHAKHSEDSSEDEKCIAFDFVEKAAAGCNVSSDETNSSQLSSIVDVAITPKKLDVPIVKPIKQRQGKTNRKYEKRMINLCEDEKLKKQRKPCKKEPKHICHLCGSPFYCLTNFKNHMNRHNGEKTFACEQCPQKFYTHQMLKRHNYHHTGERPFACSLCSQTFIDKYGKVQHELAHANARPYKCKECGKAFNKSYVLKNHMLTHTGIREFSCTLCQRSFLQKKHLVTHYRSMLHKQNEEQATAATPQ